MTAKRLTPKQQRFVEEYLVDLNATQAAIRAGYSARTANRIGHENLTKLDIQAAIEKALAERSKRTEVTQDMVVKELVKIGFANMATYATWGGEDGVKLVASASLPDGASEVVQEITATTTETTTKDGDVFFRTVTRFKLHDKKGALVDLGKHLGMFPNRVEHTGKDGGKIEVEIDFASNLTHRLDTLAAREGEARVPGEPDTG